MKCCWCTENKIEIKKLTPEMEEKKPDGFIHFLLEAEKYGNERSITACGQGANAVQRPGVVSIMFFEEQDRVTCSVCLAFDNKYLIASSQYLEDETHYIRKDVVKGSDYVYTGCGVEIDHIATKNDKPREATIEWSVKEVTCHRCKEFKRVKPELLQ